MNSSVIWIWLSQIGRPVNRNIQDLLKIFGDADKIWDADCKSALPDIVLRNRELTERLLDLRRREKAEQIYEKALSDGGKIVHLGMTNDYPLLLSKIYSAPPVLYYYGKLPEQKRKLLAMVGSRSCTVYGKNSVYKLAAELAYCGIGIVSGLAKGIDAKAHEGALAAGGYTLAVLGGGADVIYPYENIHLYYRLREYGCIMSEYPPGTQPLRNHFPARNRIIAGLTFGTFVCEAALSSGTMITVDRALEEGRQVYAMPGNIDSEYSRGTNALIKSNAICVTDYKDIISDIGYEIKKEPDSEELMKIKGLSGNLLSVGEAISRGAATISSIVKETGLKPAQIQSAITVLEIKGIIHRGVRGDFSL